MILLLNSWHNDNDTWTKSEMENNNKNKLKKNHWYTKQHSKVKLRDMQTAQWKWCGVKSIHKIHITLKKKFFLNDITGPRYKPWYNHHAKIVTNSMFTFIRYATVNRHAPPPPPPHTHTSHLLGTPISHKELMKYYIPPPPPPTHTHTHIH